VALFVRHGNKVIFLLIIFAVSLICIARVQQSAGYSHKAVSHGFDLDQDRSAQCDYSIEHATCSYAKASFQPEVFAMKISHRIFAGVSLLALSCTSALAQQITGVPGSPGATTTITGQQLPPPDSKFGGVIKEKASESTAWWAPRVVPPKGAPNVLLIMTDDQGFGAPSTFGGVIPTPAMDRIAAQGLRYTNFHSTSLCSPTRAALITGRNHHSVGFGVVGEISTGFPGYDSIIPIEKGTIGTILKANGYATSWFGKDHNTPSFQSSQAGPFNQWPNGMGFEYFYGFVGGDASQWQPNLFRNTTAIYPFQSNPSWNLETAMADEAIQHMKQLKEIAPDKPFFVYYVPGATHAPHHPTPEWIKKIGDMHLFDDGWNKVREKIFANQKRLGIMPENAKLTPWPKELPQWDSLGLLEKKLFIRQADVYGAYLAYADNEIGRVIQAVEDLGELDNTLIIYIGGDNGASAEGMINGTPNEFTTFNGVPVPVKAQYLWYPFWGSDKTFPHFAAPWAWAMDTPFKWVKQVPSHFGGTAQGVVMSWPGYQRRGRHPPPVPSRHRHRPDHPRGDRHFAARYDRRHQAEPHGRGEYGVHMGQGEGQCQVDAHDPIFRDARQSLDL
jgi:arylsulfatase A-like enzyme